MVYLSLGTAVVAKHKTEELLEKLVTNHELTRDEGKRVIGDLRGRLKRAKQGTDEQIEHFINQFSEKTHLAKDEVSDFLKEVVNKPKKAGKRLSRQIEAMAEKIATRTSMTKDQAMVLLYAFIEEVARIRSAMKKKGRELTAKLREVGKKGKAFAEELEDKSVELINEMKPLLQKAMDQFLRQLQAADIKYVQSLEKRIEELEQQGTS